MARNSQERDSQWGLTQAWHGDTRIPADGILKIKEVFPYKTEKWAVGRQDPATLEWVKTDWIFPVSSDDKGEIGNPFHKDSYSMVDMHAEYAFTLDCLKGTGSRWVSGCTVNNRRRFALTFELEELKAIIAGGREFAQYLNVIGSFDKTTARVWTNSNTCIVCENTLNMNLALQKDEMTISHSRNTALRNDEVKTYLENSFGMAALFKAAMESLDRTKANENQARLLYAGLVAPGDDKPLLSTRSANSVDTMVKLFRNGLGNNGETMLDVLSGATEFYTRESAGGENRIKQYTSSEFGSASKIKAEFAQSLATADSRKGLMKRGETAIANRERFLKLKGEFAASVAGLS